MIGLGGRDDLGHPVIQAGQCCTVQVAEVFGLNRQVGVDVAVVLLGCDGALLVFLVVVSLVRRQHFFDLLEEVIWQCRQFGY